MPTKTDFLRPVKNAIKRTPIWPLLRPRRIHVYGVGAPKTGTVSLFRLFSRYRSAHEAHPPTTLEIIERVYGGDWSQDEIRNALRHRDRRWRLECESAHFLVHLADHLVELFPDAKFICTVRDPRSWLRSILNQFINRPRSRLPEAWMGIHDFAFGSPPEEYPDPEQVLEEYGLRSIDQYLSYWAWHNERILETVPPARRLLLQTSALSHRLEEIAAFAEVPTAHLNQDQSHSHKTSEKHYVLDRVSDEYVASKIRDHCAQVVRRLNDESSLELGTL